MPRSTEEPDTVEIRRERVTEEGLKLDLLVHWDMSQVEVEDEDGETHTEYEYKEEKYTINYDGNRQMARDFVKNNQDVMLAKARGKAEARGRGKMTQGDKDLLEQNRAGKGRGN